MSQLGEKVIQVNKFARRNRHLRVFSKQHLYRMHFKGIMKGIVSPITGIKKLPFVVKTEQLFVALKNIVKQLLPVTPHKRLIFQAISISTIFVVVSSLTPGGTFVPSTLAYSSDYIEAYGAPGDILVSDDSGYLVKINPQTDDSNRIGLNDYAIHTVEDGETISVIAERYGVGVNTIKWENNIGSNNTIRIGQKLSVPPVDGISYKISSGDTLDKIADKYEISSDSIIAQNDILDESVVNGQVIFLPGAEPLQETPLIASNTYRAPTVSRAVRNVDYSSLASSDAAPTTGKIFIYPTIGSVTQGYHAGHYAIDIGNRSKPPLWAAGSGTVIKASSGTWAGGYGNHVIIDHGNGIQTLYAHMDSVAVSNGQSVNQGDVIGVMGNTGRVYGVTGIHVHWEVRVNGVKQNPYNYF